MVNTGYTEFKTGKLRQTPTEGTLEEQAYILITFEETETNEIYN